MTNKKPGASRRYLIALCGVALLVVASLAWWLWPVAGADAATTPAAATELPAANAQPAPPTVREQRHAVRRHGSSDRDAAAPENPLEALCREQQQQRLTALRDQISAAESPDTAITHALLEAYQGVITPRSDPGAAGRELWNASKRWPDNLDLAWLSLQSCSRELGCDWNEQLRHLIEIDPDNAVVWMLVMDQQTPATTAYDQALHRAATSKIYDTRFGTSFLHLQPALTRIAPPESCLSPEFQSQIEQQFGHPATAGDWASVMGMGIESATAMPAFAGVARSCDAGTPQTLPISRRRDCMALLALISNSDAAMEQILGLKLQIALAGDGPGNAQLRERYRRLRWLWAHVAELQPGSHLMDVMRDGEVATWQALAKEQGLWPPPPDWLPDDPRDRSLILTGKLPRKDN